MQPQTFTTQHYAAVQQSISKCAPCLLWLWFADFLLQKQSIKTALVCRKTTTTEHKNQTHRKQCTCSDLKPFLLNTEKRNHKKRHFTQTLVRGMRHIKLKTTDHCGGREGSSMSKNTLHKTIMDLLQRLHHIQHHHMHCPFASLAAAFRLQNHFSISHPNTWTADLPFQIYNRAIPNQMPHFVL